MANQGIFHAEARQTWAARNTSAFTIPLGCSHSSYFVQNPVLESSFITREQKPSMAIRHKNKTLSTLLASVFGGFGAHRFYLYGKNDYWGCLSMLAFVLLSFAVMVDLPQALTITFLILALISFFAGLIGALVIGLTPDEKWDAQFNTQSGRNSNSGWAVILLVVLTFALGSTALIATIARGFDLYLTGGAFG